MRCASARGYARLEVRRARLHTLSCSPSPRAPSHPAWRAPQKVATTGACALGLKWLIVHSPPGRAPWPLRSTAQLSLTQAWLRRSWRRLRKTAPPLSSCYITPTPLLAWTSLNGRRHRRLRPLANTRRPQPPSPCRRLAAPLVASHQAGTAFLCHQARGRAHPTDEQTVPGLPRHTHVHVPALPRSALSRRLATRQPHSNPRPLRPARATPFSEPRMIANSRATTRLPSLVCSHLVRPVCNARAPHKAPHPRPALRVLGSC